MGKIQRAYNHLVAQIESGVEYPDAELNTAKEFNIDVEELRDMYDFQYYG